MKLYAGYDDGIYEYAVWAKNKRRVIDITNLQAEHAHLFTEQGNALKELCPDKSKVYRRDLSHDDNPWVAFKEAA